MNLKVANLVAVQFGVFVGIMSWLAYSQLPFDEPRTAAERQEPVATLASASSPGDQPSQTVDYRPDQERPEPVAEQPAPAMHQYSAAAVQHNTALAAQQYYQQIAPRRYASSGVGSGYVAEAAPSYAEVAQEPAVVQADDPEPQTVAYAEPAQVVFYQQPQFVVFANARSSRNRCRPGPPFIGAHLATTHRRLDQTRLPLSASAQFERPASPSAALRRPNQSLGIGHRQNDKASSCRPTEGSRSRGRR
jgi:hypothetical protein